MQRRNSRGFTLIELMIVVVVIGILSALAWPSYQDSVKKGKRAEGKAALLQAAQSMERFMTTNNTYTTDLAAAGFRAFSGDNAANSAYNLTVAAGASGTIATSYQITAAPNNWDDSDKCGSLTINQNASKGVTGGSWTVAQCW